MASDLSYSKISPDASMQKNRRSKSSTQVHRRRAKMLTLIGVRMPDDLLSDLEIWISRNDPRLSRPEAIRKLVARGLAARYRK